MVIPAKLASAFFVCLFVLVHLFIYLFIYFLFVCMLLLLFFVCLTGTEMAVLTSMAYSMLSNPRRSSPRYRIC